MKYLASGSFYLVMWTVLLSYFFVDRIVKYLIILFKILWYLKTDNGWLDSLETIDVIIPIPVLIHWKVQNAKDYFLMRNWECIYVQK